MKRILKIFRPLLTVPLLAGLSLGTIVKPTTAQAFEPFVGQMMTVGFNFCPRGWALANGALLPINQNTALFSLLGTTFGGDGRTSFGLPDLRGRQVTGVGTGAGLAPTAWGQRGGGETTTLTVNEMPSHNHIVNGSNAPADRHGPGTDILATAFYQDGTKLNIYSDGAPNKQMNPAMISHTGNGQAFSNEDPYLGMYVCIALVGIYPSRN